MTNTRTKAHHLPPVFRWRFLSPRFWPTWVLLGFLWLVAQLPVGVNQWLGKQLGRLLYRTAKRRREIAHTNIRLCFPELDPQAQTEMLRQTFESTAIGFFETALALWGPARHLRRCYTITGLEYLEAAKAQGQGVLLLGSHLTTLDMAGRLLAFHVKVDVLYRQDPNPLLAYMLVRAREGFNGDCIITVETRRLINHLRSGRVVWYAPDQDYGIKHGVFAPFFGIPAVSVSGTGRFARLGKAQVIPFSHYRNDQGHYEIRLGPPLAAFPSGEDLADCTRVNQVLEDMIRVKPEQYLWVHKRFKSRPAGEPDFYKR